MRGSITPLLNSYPTIQSILLRINRMTANVKASVKLMIGQTPVEFNLDAEGGVSFSDVKDFIDAAMLNGFTVPKQWQNTDSVIGKKGTVDKISPVEGTKMWEVHAMLDEGIPFTWKEFSPTAFRLNDRIEVTKNDRGFKVGRLIDEKPEQNKLPF